MSRFRVTVEDLELGTREVTEVSSGDFMLIPFPPCRLDSVQSYHTGTRVMTVRNHHPEQAAVIVEGPKSEAAA